VGHDDIEMRQKRCITIEDIPSLNSKKELSSFLGLTAWLCHFTCLRDASLPLRKIAKCNIRFKWNDELENAFKECKRLMMDTKSGILRTPVELEPYVLFTDASKSHIGSILTQIQEPSDKEISNEKIQKGTKRIYLIKFFSKMLEQRVFSLPICLKELFSLSESLKHFHTHLIGNEIHFLWIQE
jgi:hypothetical protein